MPQTVQLKIVVAPTKRCLALLRFIKEHLRDLGALNVRIHIVRAPTDPAKLKILTKQGITSTPTLIGSDGKLHIGDAKIYGMINANLRKLKEAADQRRVSGNLGYSDVQDYWMSNLFAGQDKSGRMMPRDDGDEGIEEDAGGGGGGGRDRFSRAMQSMEQRRKNRSSRGGQQRRPQQRGRQQRREVEPMDDEPDYDNVDVDDEMDEPTPPMRGGKLHLPPAAPRINKNAGPDAMDREMMDAWLDNNTGPAEY